MDPVQSTPTSFRELRERYTQRRLAQRLTVHLSTVQGWEYGRRPRLGHIKALAIESGRPVAELIRDFWWESPGDPCPCGCGGVKVIPENDEAKQLHIALACQGGCGRTEIYVPSETHPKFCLTCRAKVDARENSKPSQILSGMTVAEIARQLGAESRRVALWEQGQGLPHWRWFAVINQRLPAYGDALIQRFSKWTRPVFGHARTLGPPYRVTFDRCLGYNDHGRTAFHAPRCLGMPTRTRGQIYWLRHKTEFRTEAESNSGEWQRAFWDEQTKRFRCRSCAQASFALWQLEQRIKEWTQSPNAPIDVVGTADVIRSREQREKLLGQINAWARSEAERKFFLNLQPMEADSERLIKAAVKRRRPHSPGHIRSRTMARIAAEWSKKPHYNWNLCRSCGWIIVSGDRRLPQICRDCQIHFPKRRIRKRVRDENLRIYMQWTVLHHLGKQSFRQIAKEQKRHFRIVVDKIRFVVEHLDPNKVIKAFRGTAILIREEAKGA